MTTRRPNRDAVSFPLLSPETGKAGPDVSVFDPENSYSLVNLVDLPVRKAIEQIPPKLLLMTERELRREAEPDDEADCLKSSFFLEYLRVIRDTQDGRPRAKMVMKTVYGAICTKEKFYGAYLSNPRKLAWIVTPPVNRMLQLHNAAGKYISLLSEHASLSPFRETVKIDPVGNVTTTRWADAKVMSEQRQTAEFLLDVVHGLTRTKAEAPQVQVNNIQAQQSAPLPETASLEDIEKIEAKLESQAKALKGDVVEAEEESHGS